MKYCDECKHCIPKPNTPIEKALEFSTCAVLFRETNGLGPISKMFKPEPQLCSVARKDYGIHTSACGPEGKLWEAKDGERSLVS